MKKVVHVAVAVVTDSAGRVLLALRPESAHQGGLWEFPGGKCEPGETVDIALHRELNEETGISVRSQKPFCLVRHDYGDKEVLLDVRRVTEFDGVAVGREGQPIRWAEISSLNPQQFPAANRYIIRRLQLPECLAITGVASSAAEFLRRFTGLLESGPEVVLLRSHDLSPSEFRARASLCISMCREQGVRLIVNVPPERSDGLQADGLHVTSAVLRQLQQRPVAEDQLFGASCHNLAELRLAEQLGADYAFLSPVQSTVSHPGQRPLGWTAFRDAAASVNMPIYALGGMGPEDVAAARACGGAGIAAISAFWPTAAESELLSG